MHCGSFIIVFCHTIIRPIIVSDITVKSFMGFILSLLGNGLLCRVCLFIEFLSLLCGESCWGKYFLRNFFKNSAFCYYHYNLNYLNLNIVLPYYQKMPTTLYFVGDIIWKVFYGSETLHATTFIAIHFSLHR